MNRVISKSF